MALPALRVGLFGVVAVVPAMVTAYAVSRPVAADCPIPPAFSQTVEAAPPGGPIPPKAAPPVDAKPRIAAVIRPPATRAAIAVHIGEVARRHRMSERLVAAVIAVESEWNPRAVSPRGARGLMQLMPDTAAMLGVRDPFDPRQNIDGGARYLKELMQRFDNDLPLALAAYNAGTPAVLTHGGVPPYPETREFVRRVMSRLAPDGAAVATAPEVSVDRVAPRSRVALLPRAAKRDAVVPVGGAAALAVSVSLREPLGRDAEAPRESADGAGWGRWAQIVGALGSAEAPPPRRDDAQSP